MVKDMRYIIKKIIIGVGIALAIMCIKTNVFALEYEKGYSVRIGPNSICHTPAGSSQSCGSPQGWWDNNISNNYYGLNLNYSGYGGFVWYVPVNGAVDGTAFDNAIGDLTFIYVSSSSSGNADPYPLNFVVSGVSRYVSFSCYNDSSLVTHPTEGLNEGEYAHFRKYTGVRCPNVPLDQDYRITQSASTFVSGTMGITAATWSLKTNASQEIANAVNETNSTIKDSTVDNSKAESDINTMKDKVASNGTITQLLTLPITLYQAILNSVNGSCSSYSLGSLLGTNLTLPCINLENYLGSTIWGIIDMVCSGLFILVFRKKMVDIFNHMTSLNDRGNELE